MLVKTLACGICGSDLHAFHHADKMVEAAQRSGSSFAMDTKKDIVFGHEFCAEELDHGPGTEKKLKPGTRVCSMPLAITMNGEKAKVDPVGYSNTVPGGFAEQMVLNELMLLEVPNGLPTEQAALTEPMAVGWHAVEKANLTPDDIPLVIGCGPAGLAVIAGLKIKGVHPIIAADFSPARRKLAEQMGADIVLDPKVEAPYARWTKEATPEGYDAENIMTLLGMGPKMRPGVIFECVGVPGVIQQIFEGAPRGARVVVVGVCMEQDRFEPFFGINKELNVQFVLGYTPEEFALTLGHLAEGKIDGSPLVTGKVGVEGVKEAFAELGNPEKHAKILVEPWRGCFAGADISGRRCGFGEGGTLREVAPPAGELGLLFLPAEPAMAELEITERRTDGDAAQIDRPVERHHFIVEDGEAAPDGAAPAADPHFRPLNFGPVALEDDGDGGVHDAVRQRLMTQNAETLDMRCGDHRGAFERHVQIFADEGAVEPGRAVRHDECGNLAQRVRFVEGRGVFHRRDRFLGHAGGRALFADEDADLPGERRGVGTIELHRESPSRRGLKRESASS